MLIAVSGGLTITAAAQGAPAPAVTETPAEAAIVKNFEDRIAAFEKLAHTAQKAAPTPKSTPSTTQLEASRKVVAARLRRVRASAKIGDIFTPDVAALLRRRLALTWNGPKGAAIRASLRHGEPLATKALPVNSSYPKAVPLQSTPPDLLAVLPPLPNDLEYRFVGRDLILHSLPSNLVVDVLPDALPPAP
ncbi:MAG TPA: hypothetical protein VN709_11040 [Terriglobales bacterium]|nr:hypothetical protein [Terriglobales bacterium]